MARLTGLAAKKVRINLLYDFYGQLLTAKQRALLKLYYQADLSLGEIADQQEVSRQAVYDILKRSERTLEKFEAKLQLVEKHMNSRSIVTDLQHELGELQDALVGLAKGRSWASADDAGDQVTAKRLKDVATRIGVVARRLKAFD